MKFKFLIRNGHGREIRVVITCDKNVKVHEVARKLFEDNRINTTRHLREHDISEGYMTLLGKAPNSDVDSLIDPMLTMASCGLQSGWNIQVVSEFGSNARRLVPIVAQVEVLNTSQKGAKFSVVFGENTLGRDANNRLSLRHKSVSRAHALIHVGENIVVKDLDSANGVRIRGKKIQHFCVTTTTELQMGEVILRITPLNFDKKNDSHFRNNYVHTRAPLVQEVFKPSTRELPEPPLPQNVNRLPLLAMAPPVVLGIVMFAFTQSPMSLVMIAFAPLMMIGNWLDGFTGGRRKNRTAAKNFRIAMNNERNVLLELREQEIEARSREVFSLEELEKAVILKSPLLWSQHSQRMFFLTLCIGRGELPSKNTLVLPERRGASAEQWRDLLQLFTEFGTVAPVPHTLNLTQYGSFALTPLNNISSSLLSNLIVQLVTLHSPKELIIVAISQICAPFFEPTWLTWLPHADTLHSKIHAEHIARDDSAIDDLLDQLESLLRSREKSSQNSFNAVHQSFTLGPESNYFPAIIVICVDWQLSDLVRSRLIALAENGKSRNIHVIWLANDKSQVPYACRVFLELPSGSADYRVHDTVSNEITRLEQIELISAEKSEIVARSLSSITDASLFTEECSDLPTYVQLSEIHPVDFLAGYRPILQSWERNGSVKAAWETQISAPPISIKATIGRSLEGNIVLDFRANGPHALVAGTTGSGKSELLQTLIMSLAVTVSPDCLNFLLFDYKGGAAFAECVDLPHTVGLVTDLTAPLARRVLASLSAELRFRERLLNELQAKDLISLEMRREKSVPPVLMIIIDEFAALAKEMPDFIEGILDIAQRGRSLGLHLILATQRPAGVVKESIRANTNIRIALRMTDSTDSVDVVGLADAANIDVSTPGRAVMRSGSAGFTHFQAGYLGSSTAQDLNQKSIQIQFFNDIVEQHLESTNISNDVFVQNSTFNVNRKKDIELIRDYISEANTVAGLDLPRKPWLNPLNTSISLQDLSKLMLSTEVVPQQVQESVDDVIIGLADIPAQQKQLCIGVKFDEIGNLALSGASGTGKTTALITIAASVSAKAKENPTHIFVIDATNGSLNCLNVLLTVATVTTLKDHESVLLVLRKLSNMVQERAKEFNLVHAHNLLSFRQMTKRQIPRVFLLIDGYDAFHKFLNQTSTQHFAREQFADIMQLGRALGIHVIITALRPSEISSAHMSSVQQSILFRLASPGDYVYLGIKNEILDDSPPGRCVFVNEKNEVQLAHVGESPTIKSQRTALEKINQQLKDQLVQFEPKMKRIPSSLTLTEIQDSGNLKPIIGLELERLEPFSIDPKGLAVIAGPQGSGVSSAALTCVESIKAWCIERHQTVETILLSFIEEVPLTAAHENQWTKIARGYRQVKELVSELTSRLEGDYLERVQAHDGSHLENIHSTTHQTEVKKGSDHQLIIVVERPTYAESTDALSSLITLAKSAKRSEALVIFEFETNSSRNIWELMSVLRQPSWAIALQPDENDSATPIFENLGRVKRSDFQPGRGFYVSSGLVQPVLIAQTEPQNASRREAARSG